jgi:hypothetical protein
MMKRCPITGVTREKTYNIGKEHQHTRILYMTANPNGEAETIKVSLKPRPRLKKTVFEMDFSELTIKGRSAAGNILTKHAVHKITMKEKGVSTLGGRKIWFDEDVNRLNADARGIFLGEFSGEDSLLIITKSGGFRITNFDLTNHFEDDLQIIEKYRPSKIWSAAYYDAEQEYYYIKRFHIEPTEKLTSFIGDHPDSRLIQIMEVEYPRLELKFGGKNKDRDSEIIEVAEYIGVKSYKARGKRLSNYEVKVIEQLEPLIPDKEPEDKVDVQESPGNAVVTESAKNGSEQDPENGPETEDDQEEVAATEEDSKTKKEVSAQEKPTASAPGKAAPEQEKKSPDSKVKKPATDSSSQRPDEVPFEVVDPEKEKKPGSGKKTGIERKPGDEKKAEGGKKTSAEKKPDTDSSAKKAGEDKKSNGQMKLEL